MRIRLMFGGMLMAYAAFFVMILVAGAKAQEIDADMRGPHPHGAHDPYVATTNQNGTDCCKGRDCARFYGTPVPGEQSGYKGWFFGKHFIRADQIVKVETLPVAERGFHHLCIHEVIGPLCGYVAAGF